MSSDIVIDPEAIENLRALTPEDPESFLKDIISIFVEDTPLRLAELQKSMAAGDRIIFTRAAHSIKGSASNLGAMQLRALASELEQRSKTEELSTLDARLKDLEAAFALAKTTLEKLIRPA
jgi:HPt (histidine-containing phosphotransfer) domain-containing protein